MFNPNGDGLLGAICLSIAFLFVAVFMFLILPFRSHASLRRGEKNHRANNN